LLKSTCVNARYLANKSVKCSIGVPNTKESKLFGN
jgi:hypothetical protein